MNQTGKIVISPQFAGHPSGAFSPHDAIAYGFHDGLAPAKMGKKWGYINVSGQFVISPQFDEARAFREGRVAVKIGEQWGFIDTTGKSVTPPQFDSVQDFSDGLAQRSSSWLTPSKTVNTYILITQANSFGLLNQAQSLFGKALHENAAKLF